MNRLLNKEELVRLRYLIKINITHKQVKTDILRVIRLFEKVKDKELNIFLIKAYKKYENGKDLLNDYIVPKDLISSSK